MGNDLTPADQSDQPNSQPSVAVPVDAQNTSAGHVVSVYEQWFTGPIPHPEALIIQCFFQLLADSGLGQV